MSRTLTAALEPVTPAAWGLEGSNSNLPATSLRVLRLTENQADFASRYAALLGTRWVCASDEHAAQMNQDFGPTVREFSPFGLHLLRSAATLPRLFLARPHCVSSAEAAFQALATEPVRRGREAAIECAAPLPVAAGEGSLGRVSVQIYQPERVLAEVEAIEDAVLVVNDSFHPGWSVEVDGQPGQLLRANYAVRGVPLAQGRHSVELRYRTPGLIAGAWLSCSTLIASLGVGLILGRRKKSGPT
jgi:hypothetical protein